MEQTNLYSITIPPMRKSLLALSTLLDTLSTHAKSKQLSWQKEGEQESALLESRLIADQFPFVRQVQIACDNAKGVAARLAEIEVPRHEDSEKTVAELKARIDTTIAFLDSIQPEQVAGKEGVTISLPYWSGKTMNGFDYVTSYSIPNFYFHVTTAYAILRKNGVMIGKMDYMGELPLA
jgi:uncharacterized protein